MPGSPNEEFVLETERLRLRRLSFDDTDRLLGIFSDPEAMRYYPSTKDRDETELWIKNQVGSYLRYGFGLWAVELRDEGVFVGQCGLTVQEVAGVREIELGYLFLREHWHRGLATEAAAGCRDHALETLGLSRLISLIDPANLPSRRVAERIGMKLERNVEKWDKQLCVYALQKV